MRNGIGVVLVQALLVCGLCGQVPEAVQAEVSLEKRYWAALDAGQKALDEARVALSGGLDQELVAKSLAAADCVEYALKTLEAMGKHPSQNGKNYKRAELRTRDLLRRIDTLVKDAGIDERSAVEGAKARIGRVHDALISGVMSRRP